MSNNKLKPLIIHHSKDLDGITSGVLAGTYWSLFINDLPTLYENKFEKPRVLGWDYEDSEDLLDLGSGFYNYYIFIDVTPSNEWLQKVNNYEDIIVEIYDHHEKRIFSLMDAVGFEPLSDKLKNDYENNSIIRISKDNINFTIAKNYSASYIYYKTIFSPANHYIDSLLSICNRLGVLDINLSNFITKYPEFKLPKIVVSVLSKHHELIEYSVKQHKILLKLNDYIGFNDFVMMVDAYDTWKWNTSLVQNNPENITVSKIILDNNFKLMKFLEPMLLNEGFHYFIKKLKPNDDDILENDFLNILTNLLDEPFIVNSNKINPLSSQYLIKDLFSMKYNEFSLPELNQDYSQIHLWSIVNYFRGGLVFIKNPLSTNQTVFLFRLLIKNQCNRTLNLLMDFGEIIIKQNIRKVKDKKLYVFKNEKLNYVLSPEKYDYTVIDYCREIYSDCEFVIFINDKNKPSVMNSILPTSYSNEEVVTLSVRSLTQSNKIDLALMMQTLFGGGGHFHASGGTVKKSDLPYILERINHYILNHESIN